MECSCRDGNGITALSMGDWICVCNKMRVDLMLSMREIGSTGSRFGGSRFSLRMTGWDCICGGGFWWFEYHGRTDVEPH